MPSPDLLARLKEHAALGKVPLVELAWLVAHGVPRSYRAGDVTTPKAQSEEWLQIVLSGRLAIHADRGAGSRKIVEWHGGDVCGLMPYSRGGAPPGDTVVEEPTDTLAVHRDHLAGMIRECPGVTAMLVHAMLDRARHFTSSDYHDEKLVSLGTLAAGLAHELNNPASAASRGAQRLAQAVADAESAARALATDIDTATSGISGLVAAVKGFTYMDRAPTSEPVDIRRGIRDTLTVLGAKTRAKSVAVTVDLAADLPSVNAFGAELNQVWANLIDNALDAVAASGRVEIAARRERDCVVVLVADDGPGIPSENLGRIFDPFFTTKGVGQGTGLGLDIVRRLVQRHDGEIALDSRPGRTEFKVSLPVA
jgi:signal transduction histidine kinase